MANIASHTAIQGDTTDVRKVTRALISVSNKENIVELGKFLVESGVEILSTGGTDKKLRDNGVPVTSVKDYTGSKEILNGRLKTLHPKIHGGILAVRGNQEHEKDMGVWKQEFIWYLDIDYNKDEPETRFFSSTERYYSLTEVKKDAINIKTINN